jgi:regulator of protease activity HflC (stomatin/prohibitin superfamily)
MIASLIPVLLILIFGAVIVGRHVKKVPQSKRLVISRLGRFHAIHNPGIAILVPFIDKGELIDVDRQTVELKPSKVFIRDGDPVNMSINLAYQVTEPAKALSNVADFKSAIVTLSETHLRKVCSSASLTELLSERPKLQDQIREAVMSAAQEWGLKVNELVISSVDVPEEVQNELRRKAEKERLRRLMDET